MTHPVDEKISQLADEIVAAAVAAYPGNLDEAARVLAKSRYLGKRTETTENERKLLRLITLLGTYGNAKFRDEWWPGNSGPWIALDLAAELNELLDFADQLSYQMKEEAR